MSAGALLLGVVCGGLFVGSGMVVSVAVKRAFFAAWAGSEAVVVVVLVWICWALALGQLLGAVGLLRRGALVVSALATAGVAVAATRKARSEVGAPNVGRPDSQDSAHLDAPPGNRYAALALLGATALLVLVVAAVWVTRTVISVHRGINDPDSLGYHLPFATTFAQTGYANQHLYAVPFLPVHFYPANDELLVGMALALTHSVAFAAVKNLLYGAFILVAAHAIGKRFGAGVAAVAGVAIVLGLPVIAFSQSGEAVNDALLVLVVIGGLALLAHARERPAPYVLAMACAGVAMGIKFSAGYPAVGLAIFALVLLRTRVTANRLRWAVTGCVAATALGVSWYVRNAITYGNPIPPTKVHLGPFHLRQIPTAAGPKSFSVLGYLVHGEFLPQFRHGLVLGLGPFVVLLSAIWILGAVAMLASGDGYRRGLGVLALVGAVGYLATPASAWGLVGPGHSTGAFVINLHYAATAFVIASIGAGVALARWRQAWLVPAFGVLVVATGIRPGQRIAFWSPQMGGIGFRWLLAAAVLGAAAVFLAQVPKFQSRARVIIASARGALAVAAAAAVVALVGVAIVAGRYASQPATDSVQRWAAHAHGAKIAAWVPDTALLYGPASANRVVTLTQLADHAPVPLSSCPAWMQTVITGHFGFSAVLPLSTWNEWLASDPAFKLVAEDQLVAVYQVVGRPNVNCPGQG